MKPPNNLQVLNNPGLRRNDSRHAKPHKFKEEYLHFRAQRLVQTFFVVFSLVAFFQGWHGLSSQASYTWSHSLDEGTQWRNTLPQDSTNIKGDYGNSDYDVRNTFNTYLIYNLPGLQTGPHWLSHGWQLNSLITLRGGEPFSVYSSSDNSGTSEGYQRATQVAR